MTDYNSSGNGDDTGDLQRSFNPRYTIAKCRLARTEVEDGKSQEDVNSPLSIRIITFNRTKDYFSHLWFFLALSTVFHTYVYVCTQVCMSLQHIWHITNTYYIWDENLTEDSTGVGLFLNLSTHYGGTSERCSRFWFSHAPEVGLHQCSSTEALHVKY